MDPDYTEKMQGYIESLEKEKSKILVFQRELPLCLELVSQAIESCKQQLSGTSTTEYNVHGQSDCSEQTTSTEGTPMLEEFIPMKRVDDDVEEDEDHEHHSYNKQQQQISDTKKKSEWLRSAQLWNQNPDPLPKQDSQPPRKVVSVVEVKRNNGAFQPFHREKSVPQSSQSSDRSNLPVSAAATSSTAEPATGSGSSGGKREEKGQNLRKQRRCWSPELHRRFLQALQQLGGSHAATPKQIRELMKVDSLTNDEVKSHLQKFRLHTRRPSTTIHNNSSQPPQIVVVGGIWVPPQEYNPAMATTDAAKATAGRGIYTPIATTPHLPSVPGSSPLKASQNQRKTESEGRSSHSTGGGLRSHSPSTSSSSHTTTASPMY